MAAITVEELRQHLNITDAADDALLGHYLEVAKEHVQAYVDPDLVPDMDQAPASIVLAVKMLVGHWYESREAVAIGVQAQVLPDGAMDLVGPFRRFVF
jgi:uncharacterized phage protein (predicted DNA packaging)